ncbi:TerC family protein [Halalkalibacter nanhaiisediminis]|uniref:YkoY family integral membrane protein n=1 Tax=Halalkalibacter nanhaiisediminis TaxID=688079 RepID=A0A562QBD0_9BACI|nr:TerC family protein [Halalkalibacter nanhaiisediminis]TWI54075.1 YkoY family integral membrane protein [Halalkalibacter nanhaiisediminis]
MELSILLEYGWVLLILIALEGILAADNALVIATMVKHLPEHQRKKALFYGLAGAFVFRFASLFLISFLVDIWQVQAIGALYLFGIAVYHLLKKHVLKNYLKKKEKEKEAKGSGFWMTVVKVELADIAFAVDAILAAVALAVMLPTTNLPTIGGLDGGHFAVILAGGLIGLVIMRFAASYFVTLLDRRPGLETAAYLVVAWVGVKLAVYAMAHPDLAIISQDFAKGTTWKIIFWSVLLIIGVSGWFLSKDKTKDISPDVKEGKKVLEETKLVKD